MTWPERIRVLPLGYNETNRHINQSSGNSSESMFLRNENINAEKILFSVNVSRNELIQGIGHVSQREIIGLSF